MAIAKLTTLTYRPQAGKVLRLFTEYLLHKSTYLL